MRSQLAIRFAERTDVGISKDISASGLKDGQLKSELKRMQLRGNSVPNRASDSMTTHSLAAGRVTTFRPAAVHRTLLFIHCT